MHLIYDPAQVLTAVLGAAVYVAGQLLLWGLVFAVPAAALAVLAVRGRWGLRLTAKMAPALIWRRHDR